MRSRRDATIREAVYELVESTPLPPPFDDLDIVGHVATPKPQRRLNVRSTRIAAAVIAAAAIIGWVGWTARTPSTAVLTPAAPSSTASISADTTTTTGSATTTTGTATTATVTAPRPSSTSSLPLVMVTDPTWVATAVSVYGSSEGEVRYTNGTDFLTLFWTDPADYDPRIADRANSADSRSTATIDGVPADVFVNPDDIAAIWRSGDFTLEARYSSRDLESFTATAETIATVDRASWFGSLPADVLDDREVDDFVATVLADVPLPPKLTLAQVRDQTWIGNPAQVGLQAFSIVVCGWIDEWLTATERGEPADNIAAVLASSHDWTYLKDETYAPQLWNLADAANGALVQGGSEPVPLTRESVGGTCAATTP
jgi:hypothetical protein